MLSHYVFSPSHLLLLKSFLPYFDLSYNSSAAPLQAPSIQDFAIGGDPIVASQPLPWLKTSNTLSDASAKYVKINPIKPDR